jgi:hypothetical protein
MCRSHLYVLHNTGYFLCRSGWNHVCSGLGILQAEGIQSTYWHGRATDLPHQSGERKPAFRSCWQNRTGPVLQVMMPHLLLYPACHCRVTVRLSCIWTQKIQSHQYRSQLSPFQLYILAEVVIVLSYTHKFLISNFSWEIKWLRFFKGSFSTVKQMLG